MGNKGRMESQMTASSSGRLKSILINVLIWLVKKKVDDVGGEGSTNQNTILIMWSRNHSLMNIARMRLDKALNLYRPLSVISIDAQAFYWRQIRTYKKRQCKVITCYWIILSLKTLCKKNCYKTCINLWDSLGWTRLTQT